jgi:ABC-type sugar transport system, ATPase component
MDEKPLLEISGISKVFPGVQALDNVSMSFRKGEVHALLGENGAGKSTFIKILTGAQPPSSGTIRFDGREYASFTPMQAKQLGLSAIYQEFNLFPHLDISENIFYGRELKKGIFRDKKKMDQLTAQYCKDMGIELDPRTLVKDLGVAQQQIVEIVKSVSTQARVLIMDEPSAPLTNREVEAMFRIVRRLKANGVTIIYISHRLEELFEICDRVSVMRDGKYILTEEMSNMTREKLIAAMVGRELGESYPQTQKSSSEVVLEVSNLSNDRLHNISFQLKKGEILGISGLVGAGRTELARALFGADPVISGQIKRGNLTVKFKNPRDAIANRIGLLPEDRKQSGLILDLSIRENITFGILRTLSGASFIKSNRERTLCDKLIRDLQIKTPGMEQKAGNLSGGNQQKVVIAKWLASDCDILIFDEPTRGIDVGAKQEIYVLLKTLTEQGKSIIMISSEMPELIGMSNRILVMREGKIAGELARSEFSQEKILELASSSV